MKNLKDFLKNDDIQKKMSYFNDLKVPCVNCGRKVAIHHSKKSVLCSWCHHLVFRTKKEYDDYYNRQNFKKQLRKAMARNEHIKRTGNN